MNFFLKGYKCRTIQMNALEYKGLKIETINNKLEVSNTKKPLTMCTIYAGQQLILSARINIIINSLNCEKAVLQ